MLKSEKKQIFLKKIFYKYCRNFSILNLQLWRRRQDSWCITTVLYRWTLFLWKNNNNNNNIKDPIKKVIFFPPFFCLSFFDFGFVYFVNMYSEKSNDCRCDMSMSFLFWNKEKLISVNNNIWVIKYFLYWNVIFKVVR